MVKKHDLPILIRSGQLFLEPVNLLRLGISALECEEPDLWGWAKCVIELPFHVKQLVIALLAGIVVTQRGKKPHPSIKQRLVRYLKFIPKVLRPLRSVKVVSDQHDKVILESLMKCGHL